MKRDPRCTRRLAALYYYTNTWAPAAQEHSTLLYISQKHKVRLRLDRILKVLVQDLMPPIFRKSFRAIKRLAKGEKVKVTEV